MPNDFSLEDIASVDTDLDSFFNTEPRSPQATSGPSKPDFTPADVVSVDDFSLDQILSVEDPVVYTPETLKSKDKSELVADKTFEPVLFASQNLEELQRDPDTLEKLIQAYRERETRGTTVKEKLAGLANIREAGGIILSGVKEAGKAAVKLSPVGLAVRAARGDAKESIKTAAELASSVELAGIGTADLLRRSQREVAEGIEALPTPIRQVVKTVPSLAAFISAAGTGESKAQKSEQDWQRRFFDDVAAAQQVEKARQGNAEVAKALQVDGDRLKSEFGIELNPETIDRLSVVTDPINYIPVGATVGVVGKIGGKATRALVASTGSIQQAKELAKALNTATQLAGEAKTLGASVAGSIAKGAGQALETVGSGAEKAVRAVGGTASGLGLGGILGGDIYSALGGAAIAKGAPRVTQEIGKATRAVGEMLKGERAVPGALRVAGEAAKGAAVGTAKGLAEGAVIGLPFLIGARPDEEQFILGAVGIGGLTRGALEGGAPVARAAGSAAQNRLAQTVFRRVEQSPSPDSPSYGTDPTLDTLHQSSVTRLPSNEQKLVNWSRELLRESGGEIYVVDGNTFRRESGQDALGYTIGVGEKINPDGSVTPLTRVLLNADSEALSHEFFHVLETLDPQKAEEFKQAISESLTPEQKKDFETLYNSRMNPGLPESSWTYRLDSEQVVGEISAEVFSRMLLAQDLSGVAPRVTQRAALFLSSVLEKLGAPLGGTELPKGPGVSTLGVRPSTKQAKLGQSWIQDIIQRINESGQLGEPLQRAKSFEGATPADVTDTTPISRKPQTVRFPGIKPEDIKPKTVTPPPAETIPVTPSRPPLPRVEEGGPRNIRTTRARQNDFASRRAEVTNVDSARSAALESGDANTIAQVEAVSQHLETGNPVLEIEHSGVRAEGTSEAPSGRTVRRREQEAAYIAEGMGAAPKSIREAYQKVFVPVRWEIVAGKPQLIAMSLDKVIANVHRSVKDAVSAKVESKIPYEIADGRLTDNAWGQVVDDLQAYTENQANGFRGDGERLIRPAEDEGLSIPAENPAYNPVRIPEDRVNFLNMVQGLNPPLTARVGRQSSTIQPGNVKGQLLAELQGRTPETPAVIRPQDIQKQTFPSGRTIKETNPLRNELAAAGVPVRELIEVTERINAPDILSVRPRPELRFKAPVTDVIRAGFLPKLTPGEQAANKRRLHIARREAGDAFASRWGEVRRQFRQEMGEEGWNRLDLDEQDALVRQRIDKENAPDSGRFLPLVAEAGTGLAFKGFFSSVTRGEFGKSNVPFEPVLDVTPQAEFINEQAKHTGNFDEHIAKSIPTFKETQVRKGDAIVKTFPEGARVLDVGASEGSLMKTISAVSDGAIETVSLDPNPDMAKFFREKSEVPGATYVEEAFREGFEDGGKQVPAYDPGERFDLINESMVFQFISPEREAQIQEAKRLLKPDGVLTLEEKVKNPDWKENEAKKDRDYKERYFSKTELEEKDKRVGFQQAKQETKAVGMVDNMVEQSALERLLTEQFDHVVQYWDSGNFKGYAASDSRTALDKLVSNMGDLNSEFSTAETPRPVVASRGKFSPRAVDESVPTFTQRVLRADRQGFVSLFTDSNLTTEAYRLGLELSDRTDLGVLQEAARKAHDQSREKMSAGEFDEAFSDATKAQFFREAYEAATDTGSAAGSKGWRTSFPDREPPFASPEGSFLPAKSVSIDLDPIVEAAYRTPKGRIFTGAWHGEALMKVVDAAGSGSLRERLKPDPGNPGVIDAAELTDGFITESGKFLDREQALRHAEQIGQLRVEAPGTQESFAEAGVLESSEFEARKKFLPTEEEIIARRARIKAAELKRKKQKPRKGAVKNLTGWVLPDLEVKESAVASPDFWHDQDLQLSSGDYNKRFGTKFEDRPDRMEAINAGFVRLRYWQNQGLFAVEARPEAWKKAKATVLQAALDNVNKIDHMRVNLLTERGNALETFESAIFQADDPTVAIEELVAEVKPPTVERSARRGPGLIARARSLGSFLPDEEGLLSLGLPDQTQLKQVRVKRRQVVARDRFPEALVPEYQLDEEGNFVLDDDGKPKAKAISYDLLDTPLFREAAKGVRGEDARQKAYTDALAKRITAVAREANRRDDIKAGSKWYSTARTRLRKIFGDDSKLFAELLGATSPRTPVEQNYGYALEAYNLFRAGEYDSLLKKYREGKSRWERGAIKDFLDETKRENPTRGQFLDWWVAKHDLLPRRKNGKKFSATSRAVLRVLDGSWAEEVQGPKTPNFAGNLSGSTFEATIDVWAARLLHRLSNQGNERRWRILPENETAVTDADFALGQTAFRKAAEKLEMKPDALQAILWFYEKDHWEKRGWTRGTGAEKSDFNVLLSETERKGTSGRLEIRRPQLDFELGVEDITRR